MRDLTRALDAWIAALYAEPGLTTMGHNQRLGDLNLGLGWIYYALARVVHPRRAVVIGSYRGFVPMVIGRALHDNGETGEVTFIDPGLVDDHWHDPDAVRAWFARFDIGNVRHHRATTQAFVDTVAYRALGELGLLFVDGYHTAEQARFDHEAFVPKLGPRGVALFHDSLVSRRSTIYGDERGYDMSVGDYLDTLRRDPTYQVFDLPFGTGLTLVSRRGASPIEPLLEGVQARPRAP